MKIGVSLASRLKFLARVTDMAVLASALRSGCDCRNPAGVGWRY